MVILLTGAFTRVEHRVLIFGSHVGDGQVSGLLGAFRLLTSLLLLLELQIELGRDIIIYLIHFRMFPINLIFSNLLI